MTTSDAPEPERARVVYLAARPVIVWLSDDAGLLALFGKRGKHFREHAHRYDFIYYEGSRGYVHVAQADAYFGRDDK